MNIDYGYNSKSIHISDNVERHRLYPAQHLGGTGLTAIFNQAFELYDNALDESDAWIKKIKKDYAELLQGIKLPPLRIKFEVTHDNHVIIEDMGRGVPCDIPRDEDGNVIGEPAIFPAFENDSAGGKANHAASLDSGAMSGYADSGASGQHGAGAAVSKSCTRTFDIISKSGSANGVFKVSYIEGYRDKTIGEDGLLRIGDLEPHPIPEFAALGLKDTGTRITYLFDERILPNIVNGIEHEPYDKDDIEMRITNTLLGIEDRDSLAVDFIYKGEHIEITPYSLTPEKIVGYDGTDSVKAIRFDLCSPSQSAGTAAEYSASVYIGIDPSNFLYEETTIVNRLVMKSSTIQSAVHTVLEDFMIECVNDWLKLNPKYDGGNLRAKLLTRYFRVCTLAKISKAEYGSQTKDNLTSKAFIPHFKEFLMQSLEANVSVFEPILGVFKQEIISAHQAKTVLEALEKKNVKASDGIDIAALKKELKKPKSLAEQVREGREKRKKKVRINATKRHAPEKCNVCFFEGDSAESIVAGLLNEDAPLVSVVVTGKLPNIYNPKNKEKLDSIVELVQDVFLRNYNEYLLILDPDPDGAHMRMQLIALIAEFDPQKLLEEKVFVIRTPCAKIFVPEGVTVVIDNEFEGRVELQHGEHYVNSYSCLESALSQGATKLCTFSGAHNAISHAPDLDIKTLITDPRYKIPIKAPDKEELEYLKEMLTPNSDVKKLYTNQFFTDRNKECRFRSCSSRSIGVKRGKYSLTSVAYYVTDTPNMTGYTNTSFYNLIY